MCTWSGIKCPSSIRLSFCCASLRNISPKCLRSSPYSTFRRHFGINTTWYLHSHFVWLRLSISSIANSLSCAWRLTSGSLRDGLRSLSNFYCLPGTAGGLPFVLGAVSPGRARGPQEEPLSIHDSASRGATTRPVSPRLSGSQTMQSSDCAVNLDEASPPHYRRDSTQLRLHLTAGRFMYTQGNQYARVPKGRWLVHRDSSRH